MSAWIDQVFKAGAVAKGNVVSRKKTNVDKYASMKELTKEVKKKKFHLIETGDQIIVICNKGDVKIVV